jgi:hypothetical protein
MKTYTIPVCSSPTIENIKEDSEDILRYFKFPLTNTYLRHSYKIFKIFILELQTAIRLEM